MGISFVVPIKTAPGLNAREHWAVKAKRVAKERKATHMLFPRVALPVLVVVRLVRVSPGTLDDDNLAGALKGVRDAVAFRMGLDDRSPLVAWSYAQEVGPAAVRVEVRIDALPAKEQP